MRKTIYMTLGLAVLHLSSCLQDDPKVLEQLEATKRELELVKEEHRLASAGKAGAVDEAELARLRSMEKENAQLTSEVASLRQELDGLKESGFQALTQDELMANLMVAVAPYKAAIDGFFEVEEASLRELHIPDFSEFPYRCVVHLKLLDANGAKKQLDVHAKADPQGKWHLPSMEELQSQVTARENPVIVQRQGQPDVSQRQNDYNSERQISGANAATSRFVDTQEDGAESRLPPGWEQNIGGAGAIGPGPQSYPGGGARSEEGGRGPTVQPALPGEVAGEVRIPW